MIKEFKLGAKTWKVKYLNKLIENPSHPGDYALGMCTPDELAIEISLQDNDGKVFHKTNTEQTFYHELVHVILGEMGHELYSDEFFVQTFSVFLHQFIESKKETKTDVCTKR